MAKASLQGLGLGLNGENVGGVGVVFDRSRVRILVCDPNTSPDVLDLLRRCSYQVMAVQSARQALEVLRTGTSDVDLILAEVDYPMGIGLKMLKHITKHQRLKQIPIVMMSAHDEMAVVVKCLRLGAADYLVKPLRTNELLNLWTHMWRRRRMLGLAEKHLISGNLNINDYPIEVLRSDTSESNTTSTDLFSDESHDKKLTSIVDEASNAFSNHWRSSPALELTLKPSFDESRVEQESNPTTGSVSLFPKKTSLNSAPSSAFLSYTNFCNQAAAKSVDSQPNYTSESDAQQRLLKTHEHGVVGSLPPEVRVECPPSWEPINIRLHAQGVAERHSESPLSNHGPHWSAGEQLRARYPPPEQISVMQVQPSKETHMALPAISPLRQPQFLPPGLVAAPMHSSSLMQPALQLYHGLPQELSFHVAPGLHSHNPSMSLAMPPPSNYSYFSYTFPVLHPPEVAMSPGWTSIPKVRASELKLEQAERREAALSKFRQKRKDRCFEKKIRYFSRKRLAEQRPRNRGQFVRQGNGMEMMDCRGESDDDDEEDDVAADAAVMD